MKRQLGHRISLFIRLRMCYNAIPFELCQTMLTFIDLFNIAMTCGIVFLVIASRQVAKENKLLHEKNERRQARLDKLYGLGPASSD